MRAYRKTFNCSKGFPVEYGQEWTVDERGKCVERWRVIETRTTNFTVEITEYIAPDNS